MPQATSTLATFEILFEFRKAASVDNQDAREKLMGRLEGKSVIITGAGSGIGRAASLLFSKEGAKLIIVDRSDSVKETAKLVGDAGGTVEAVMADAGSESDVKSFIDKAVSTYGRLDAIWANAGVSGGLVPLAEQTVEQWQEVLRINLIGPFLAIKYSMPHMIKQKSGSIVLHRVRCGPEVRRQRAIPTRRAKPASSAWCRPRPIRCRAPACASTRCVPA